MAWDDKFRSDNPVYRPPGASLLQPYRLPTAVPSRTPVQTSRLPPSPPQFTPFQQFQSSYANQPVNRAPVQAAARPVGTQGLTPFQQQIAPFAQALGKTPQELLGRAYQHQGYNYQQPAQAPGAASGAPTGAGGGGGAASTPAASKGAFMPPPMITTQPTGPDAAEQGPVYSWNFASTPAYPGAGQPAAAAPAAAAPAAAPAKAPGWEPPGRGGGGGGDQAGGKGGGPGDIGQAGGPSGGGFACQGGGGGDPSTGSHGGRPAYDRGGRRPDDAYFQEGGDVQDYPVHPGGYVDSNVPGRTDKLPMSVMADSYVIPADVVSGIGEGNSNAGARKLFDMMKTGPFGMRTIPMSPGKGPPDAPGIDTSG